MRSANQVTRDYQDRMPEDNSDHVLAKLRGAARPEVLEFLSLVLRLFPAEFQYRVRRALDALPAKGDNLQRVLEVVRAQWRGIQSEDWIRISIVGPSQTGKATLLGAIEAGQSASSPEIFNLVETPGLAEYLGYEKAGRFPEALDQADLILLLLDGRYEVSESTRGMLERLKEKGTPVLVALNKCDLIQNPSETARHVQKTLGQRTVAVSALRPRSIPSLLRAIVASNEKALYPLAVGFPGFRGTICRGIVTQASISCALVGAIPIPISDLLPMTAIQTSMLLKIARAYGHHLNRHRARELIPMLLSGVAVREASHRLRRQFPDKAKLIGVSAAGAWTYLLGRGAIAYFDRFSHLLEETASPRSLSAAS